jgi:hypothetical protein
MPFLGIAVIIGVITALVALRRKHQPSPPVGPMTDEEVRAMLAELAPDVPDATDYGNSIVDLLKVLRLPSDKSSRRVLWEEMKHEGAYVGSAEQNVQLHADVMKKLADREIGAK